MERRPRHSLHELLQQDRYTPEEVTEVPEIGLDSWAAARRRCCTVTRKHT